jgi:hypothetical protein
MILHTLLVAKSDKAIGGAQEAPPPEASNTSRPCTQSNSKNRQLATYLRYRLLYREDLPALCSKTKNQALVSVTKMHRESLPAMESVESGSSFLTRKFDPLDILS